jgi:hypothetical protein
MTGRIARQRVGEAARISEGIHERRDVPGVVDRRLLERSFAAQNIKLLGASMRGECAIGTLAHRPRLVAAFVVDSSFVHGKIQRPCVDDGQARRQGAPMSSSGRKRLSEHRLTPCVEAVGRNALGCWCLARECRVHLGYVTPLQTVAVSEDRRHEPQFATAVR